MVEKIALRCFPPADQRAEDPKSNTSARLTQRRWDAARTAQRTVLHHADPTKSG
jgi:hypothetical protein